MWNGDGSRSALCIRIMRTGCRPFMPGGIYGLAYYTSPLGDIVVQSEEHAITVVNFTQEPRQPEHATAATDRCILELDEYFHHGRKFFTVDLAPQGTAFQQKVWQALLDIPHGKTWSYEALAIHLGDIKAIRAVGLANGQNPIAILIPCHRVIGKHGDLVGYGGGLDNKAWLLQHEGAVRQMSLF